MNIKKLSTMLSLSILLALSFFYYSCESDDAKNDHGFAEDVVGVYKGVVRNAKQEVETYEDYIIHVKAVDKEIIEISEGVLGENLFSGNIVVFLSEDYTFSFQGNKLNISGLFEGNQLKFDLYLKQESAEYKFEGEKTASYTPETKLLPKKIVFNETDDHVSFTYDDENRFATISRYNYSTLYFEYDAEGRIARIDKENDYRYPVFFEYTTDKVKIIEENQYSCDSLIVVLNEKQQAVEMFYYAYESVNQELTITYDDKDRVEQVNFEEWYSSDYALYALKYDNMKGVFSNVNIPDWFFLTEYWLFTRDFYRLPLNLGAVNNLLEFYYDQYGTTIGKTYHYNYNASGYPCNISSEEGYYSSAYNVLYQKAH